MTKPPWYLIHSDEALRAHWGNQKKFFHLHLRSPIGLSIVIGLALILAFNVYSGVSSFVSEEYWEAFYTDRYPNAISRHQDAKDAKEATSTFRALAADAALWHLEEILRSDDIERINLNISFEDWAYIKSRRNQLLTGGHSFQNEPRKKVKIDWNDSRLKGGIRLKGINSDHREHPTKWSFAIDLKSDEYFMGMSEFALQEPSTRVYQYECIYGQLLNAIGALYPRCTFVDVSINGEHLGVMVVIERMSKELLEANGRKEGNIFRIYDSNLWALQGTVNPFLRNNPDLFQDAQSRKNFRETVKGLNLNRLAAPLVPFNSGSIKKSTSLQQQQASAVKLFNGLMTGKLAASDIFDVEVAGKALATAFLWGNFHPYTLHNLRYYFNPITFKFEVIPTEIVGNVHDTAWHKNITRPQDVFLQALVFDEHVRRAFRNYVHAYGGDGPASDQYFAFMESFDRELLQLLRTEYTLIPRAEFSTMKDRYRKYISEIDAQTFFNRTIPEVPLFPYIPETFDVDKALYAYVIKEGSKHYLELVNILPQITSVTELNVFVGGELVTASEVFGREISSDSPLNIGPTYPGFEPGAGRRAGTVRLDFKGGGSTNEIKVSGVARPQNSKLEYKFSSRLYYSAADENPIDVQPLAEILESNKFLKLSGGGAELVVESGSWRIDEFIRPPEGVGLKIEPGTTLTFGQKGGLLIRGAVYLRGTKDSPINIIVEDADVGWAGFTVMKANYWSKGSRSLLEHVAIMNTNKAQYRDWMLTGAVTFYMSDVDFSHVLFDGTVAEDALNIVHSTFGLSNVKIINTVSDGFDGDFVTGTIDNLTAESIGGDGIDFSGSKIIVEGGKFYNIHDKAVSVGEASTLSANDLEIRMSGTGFAVKDGSWGFIENSTLSDIKYSSLMAYTKKPQYGASKLVSSNNRIPRGDQAVIAQKKSSIFVDGVSVKTMNVDIDTLYKDGYMKK